MLLYGYSRCIKESARSISITWTLYRDDNSRHRESLRYGFTRSLGQDQEVNTVFGGYGRQVGRGVRQSQDLIDQGITGMRDQNILVHESIS